MKKLSLIFLFVLSIPFIMLGNTTLSCEKNEDDGTLLCTYQIDTRVGANPEDGLGATTGCTSYYEELFDYSEVVSILNTAGAVDIPTFLEIGNNEYDISSVIQNLIITSIDSGNYGRVVDLFFMPSDDDIFRLSGGPSSITIPEYGPLLDEYAPDECCNDTVEPLNNCVGGAGCAGGYLCKLVFDSSPKSYYCTSSSSTPANVMTGFWKTEVCNSTGDWLEFTTCVNHTPITDSNTINVLFANEKRPGTLFTPTNESFGLILHVKAPATGTDSSGGCKVFEELIPPSYRSGFNVDQTTTVKFQFNVGMECSNTYEDYYKDSDQDGYADNSTKYCKWELEEGVRLKDTDSKGWDCDDGIDPEWPKKFYHDNDGDTYGDPDDFEMSCELNGPAHHVANADDCDDTDARVNPETEWCLDSDKDKVCNNLNVIVQCERPSSNYTNKAKVVSEGIDNCPDVSNSSQKNSDQDTFGDACDNCPLIDNQAQQDTDGDKVGNVCDNCADQYNNFVAIDNPHLEIVKGAREIKNGYWKRDGNLEWNYYWQPDQDLDGIGDECDTKTNDMTEGGYSVSMSWKSQSLISSSAAAVAAQTFETNKTIPISVAGGYFSPAQQVCLPLPGVCFYPEGEHRVHYCGLDLKEYCQQSWNSDKTGCSSNENNWNSLCQVDTDIISGDESTDISRSHATIDNPAYGNGERWPHIAWAANSHDAASINYTNVDEHKDAIPSPQNLSKTVPSAYWNWKADIYSQYRCNEDENVNTYAICENKTGGIRQNTPIYYNLSSNFAGAEVQYLNNENINLEYFKNHFTRNDNSEYDSVEKWGMATRIDVAPVMVKYRKGVLIMEDVKNSFKNFINQLTWESSAPNIIVPLSAVAFQELSFAKYNTGGYVKEIANDYSLIESSITALPSTRQIIEGDREGVTYSISMEGDNFYNFYVNYAPSSDWHKMGEITNYHDYDLRWSSAAIYNKTVYLAGGEDDPSTLVRHLYRIVRSGEDYVVEMVSPTPVNGSDIRLISALGKLFIISDTNGQFSTWSVDPEEGTYSAISTGFSPAFRRPLNIIGTENGIYIAGKYDSADQNNTIISKFTESAGWQTIYNNVSANTGKLIMHIVDGKVMMTDILAETPETTRIELNLSDDSVVINTVPTVDIYGIEEGFGPYCLNETSDILKGGMSASGTCIPFTHPWYRQFSAGATVYSVAGKGDRLYVGTSSSIKVYDISDPAAMTLKYTFSTNSRIVYDLEVADGDIMYAATSKGIYKLSTANPDTLTSLTFYSTGSYNYQYKIQLYNDKLYVGDDNGINIRDKNTFARLAYVNTGSILDFAIADGEIAMYWSAFWDEGIQIRDADTLNMKAYDYATCYTGELTADNGEFYLSCDDYEYRFVGLPNTYLDYFPVDGDIREMQENYAYNGWAYIPDGSYVKQSTSNDVPSYCGNGVTEPGELCDGNSVECTTLDPDYTGGTAACNSTCNGYNEVNCEVDGW